MNSKPSTSIRPSPQSWDPRDDALLVYLKESENMGWKQIANYFSSRTSNACQFRWRRLKSGKLKTYNAESVVTLDPQYLSRVKNFKTGSLLVDDLKARHSRFGRRVVSKLEADRASPGSPTGNLPGVSVSIGASGRTADAPAASLLADSSSAPSHQEYLMAEKLSATSSEGTAGSMRGTPYNEYSLKQVSPKQVSSTSQFSSSLKQFSSSNQISSLKQFSSSNQISSSNQFSSSLKQIPSSSLPSSSSLQFPSSLPSSSIPSSLSSSLPSSLPFLSPCLKQPAFPSSRPQGTFSFSASPLSARRNSHLPSPEGSAVPGSLPPPPIFPRWTPEEDQLVLGRTANKLSFDELCILLPSKTNYQVRSRIQQLDKSRLSIASLTAAEGGVTLPPLKSSRSIISSLASSAPALSASAFDQHIPAPHLPLRRLSTSTSPSLYATSCSTPVPRVPRVPTTATVPSSISSSSSSSKISLFRDQPSAGPTQTSISVPATSSTRLPSISSASPSSVLPLYPPFAVSAGPSLSSRTLHSPPPISIAKNRSSGGPSASSVICC